MCVCVCFGVFFQREGWGGGGVVGEGRFLSVKSSVSYPRKFTVLQNLLGYNTDTDFTRSPNLQYPHKGHKDLAPNWKYLLSLSQH